MENLKLINDEDLIFFVITEDKEYFGEIVERYEKKLLRYANYLVKNEDLAKDIVQNSFIKAFINLNGFNRKGKFSSWIYRIVHNEAINSLNKFKKEIHLDFEIESEEGFEEDFDKKELIKNVNKCMEKIPVKYSEILILYHIEDKSYEEISDILRIPIGTVAVRLNRGRGVMKKICKR